ncbi:MAG: HAD-IIA family hydrolase, partial [Actinobacteria bacterium]|nr:HAD-IIA family hydrolase [Actinomycetota bacterium]
LKGLELRHRRAMIRPDFDGLVCDLDGVIYRGEEVVPGAARAIAELRARGTKVVFCTNNSRSTPDQYVQKLARMGINTSPTEVVTSAIVTAEVLKARGYAGKTAIVVGGAGIRQALGDVCVSVKDDPAVSVSDLVVVGWDPEFTYDAMKRACIAIRRGATLIATNDDASFPAADALWPGAGAILASIETAADERAEVMGKPHPPMMSAVARRLDGCSKIAVIGDRPDTDLAGGAARGWTTFLVLSGVTTAEQAKQLDPQPDHVLDSISELG